MYHKYWTTKDTVADFDELLPGTVPSLVSATEPEFEVVPSLVLPLIVIPPRTALLSEIRYKAPIVDPWKDVRVKFPAIPNSRAHVPSLRKVTI